MAWPTSDAFRAAVAQSHTLAYSITLATPGGASIPLTLSSGTVSGQSGQVIRRTANLQVFGGSTVFRQLSVPGATCAVQYGIDFGGGVRELVPMIKGELSTAAADLGDGLIAVNLADFGQRLQGTPFLVPQSPAATAGRIATASSAVTGGVSTTVASTASDTATIGSGNTFSDRAGMVQKLLGDAGAEGYFLPDGTFQIRDLPQVTDPYVWTFSPGTGGTVKQSKLNRPLDKLYNTVVVQPASLDGSQSWTQVVVQITDTGNPRHPNYIGTRPYVWQSPSIMSTAEAQSVGAKILGRLQGSTDSIALGAVSNPALDVGDVVRIANPTDSGTELLQHLIDSFTFDLAAGDMTLATRSAAEALV